MKHLKINPLRLVIIILLVNIVSCNEDEDEPDDTRFRIEGITAENYPKVDCSTSTSPLQGLIACKLLGLNYSWQQNLAFDFVYYFIPEFGEKENILKPKLQQSGTNGSHMNLIDGGADLIITAREASKDERDYAKKNNVELIETPIALDAFIFLVNNNNPIKTLTSKQIQDIYMGKTTNWSIVGGNNNKINPYIRDRNSGSQVKMEEIVMQGLTMPDWSEEITSGMTGPFITVRNDNDAICYSVYYYKEYMVRENLVKTIAINGIYPDKKTIENKTYPYTTEIYVTIRKDLDENSMPYQMYKLLTSDAAKSVINESGYIAFN